MTSNEQKIQALLKIKENVNLSILFSCNDIRKVIQLLYPNKAHGCDMISIIMLKICEEFISKPSETISNHALKNIRFPTNGKRQMWSHS